MDNNTTYKAEFLAALDNAVSFLRKAVEVDKTIALDETLVLSSAEKASRDRSLADVEELLSKLIG